jgi:tetratricopeptide (TPR) repeat protein
LAADAEREWFSPRQFQWFARLEADVPNLREALEFSLSEGGGKALRGAAALLPFWTTRGLLSEGRRILDRALADAPPVPSDDRAKALFGAAMLAVVQGDLRAAQTWAAQARPLAELVTDPTTRLFIAVVDVLSAQLGGDSDRGLTTLEAAVSTGGEPIAQAAAFLTLGWANEMHGDFPGALSWYEKGLALSESHGELEYRTNALWSIGIARWRLGERDEAVESLRQGLQLARQINDRRAVAACLEALAWTAIDAPRSAVVLMAAADRLRRSVGSALATISDVLVFHDGCERQVQAALGEHELEAARREGRSMNWDDAVTYALRMPKA